MWPYFNVPLEDHIRQVWLYIEVDTDVKHKMKGFRCLGPYGVSIQQNIYVEMYL